MWRTDSGHGDAATSETWGTPAIAPAPGKVTRSERIMRRAAGAVGADPEAALAGTAGSMGAALPDAARAQFETSLGTDLSTVRVHTGGASATAAEGLGARAFATGQDIHFGAGQYRPDDPFGMHLLAHEVAHTVQQRGGSGEAQFKLEVSQAGDASEVEADRAADAMVSGAPASISGCAPMISRKEDDAPAAAAAAGADPAAAGNKAVFVEFTKDGTWDGQAVLDALGKSGATVPEDLKAAILAGPKPTAQYCVALRGRVTAADTDPAKHAEMENIVNALSTRTRELVYATSRSPLQYSQLAEVARWGAQWPATGAAAAAAKDAKPEDAKPEAASGDAGKAEAQAYATKLAAEHPRLREGDKDVIRTAADTKNDNHTGEESGDKALAGWSFIHDPFANTVIAVRPNKTGLQFTFDVEKTDGDPKVKLVNTEEMSELRVKVSKVQERAAPQREQEGSTGPADRKAADEKQGRDARAEFIKLNPGAVEKWQADTAAWVAAGKKGAAPKVPTNAVASPTLPLGAPYQVNDHKTTACVSTPSGMFHDAGGKQNEVIPFTPPTNWKSWRTLATHPDGPKIGDVYYLYDLVAKQGAHMGVVKSRTPVAGHDGYETWVVTDGGQGGYDKIQLEQERTRGPFNKATGIFMSSIAEAGQAKGERKLTGWVDIDAFHAEHPPTVHA